MKERETEGQKNLKGLLRYYSNMLPQSIISQVRFITNLVLISLKHDGTLRTKYIRHLSPLQKTDKDGCDLGYLTSEKAYRIVLAGDANVGKSSFLLRLCKNEFKLNSGATLGELDEKKKT